MQQLHHSCPSNRGCHGRADVATAAYDFRGHGDDRTSITEKVCWQSRPSGVRGACELRRDSVWGQRQRALPRAVRKLCSLDPRTTSAMP